jgi:hypothetical protein
VSVISAKARSPTSRFGSSPFGSDKEVRSVADFFGLRYEIDQNDKTQINHSLRTAVIAPDGKVTKIFPGNDWTVNDLLREMKAAAGVMKPAGEIAYASGSKAIFACAY